MEEAMAFFKSKDWCTGCVLRRAQQAIFAVAQWILDQFVLNLIDKIEQNMFLIFLLYTKIEFFVKNRR